MERATKQTGYILIRAYTTSDWDACSFAIIEINENWLAHQLKRVQTIAVLTEDEVFAGISYFEYFGKMYSHSGLEEKEADDFLMDCEAWTFIETNDEELQRMQVTETQLDTHMLKLDASGNITFLAYGKHNGEEFYTQHFPLLDLTDRCGVYRK